MSLTVPAVTATQAAPTHDYTDPSGVVWHLDQTFLDWHAAGWAWDGRPYGADGPRLHTVTGQPRTELLLSLAGAAGLLQVPLADEQDLAHALDPQDDAFRALAVLAGAPTTRPEGGV